MTKLTNYYGKGLTQYMKKNLHYTYMYTYVYICITLDNKILKHMSSCDAFFTLYFTLQIVLKRIVGIGQCNPFLHYKNFELL